MSTCLSLLLIVTSVASQSCANGVVVGDFFIAQQYVVNFAEKLDNIIYVPYRSPLEIAHTESLQLNGGLIISASVGNLSILVQNGLGIDTKTDRDSLNIDGDEKLILTFKSGTDFVSISFSGWGAGGDMKVLITHCNGYISQIITSIDYLRNINNRTIFRPTINVTANETSSPIFNISLQAIGVYDSLRVYSITYNSLSITTSPTQNPTVTPTTTYPTQNPTNKPNTNPTHNPTNKPTTTNPTQYPTNKPITTHPTQNPTNKPTTTNPSQNPTGYPTHKATIYPTTKETKIIIINADADNERNDDDDDNDSVLIIGLTIGFILICILMVSISVWYWKKKQENKLTSEPIQVQYDIDDSDEYNETKGKEITINEVIPLQQSEPSEVQIEGEEITQNDTYFDIKKWFSNHVKLYENNELYFNLFIKNGFDQLIIIKKMTDTDMINIGINKLGHRKMIMNAIQNISK